MLGHGSLNFNRDVAAGMQFFSREAYDARTQSSEAGMLWSEV
jgi:hypothetical protein